MRISKHHINTSFIAFFSALILLIIEFFFIIIEKPSVFDHQKDVEKIQQYIQNQKLKTSRILEHINNLDKSDELLWLKNIQNYFHEIAKEDVHLAIYKNDTAILWNQNDFIPIVLTQGNSIFTNSTWAYINKIQHNNYSIVAFIPIKKEYPFENIHLKNYYYGNLKLKYNYQFSLFPETTSYYVTDHDGSLIFSISPLHQIHYVSYQFLFLIFLIIILLLIHYLLVISDHRTKYLLLILFTVLLLLRTIMQYFKIPSFVYSIRLFSAEVYTSDAIFSSLGDTLINSWILLLLNEYFLKLIQIRFVKNAIFKFITFILWFLFGWLWMYVWSGLIFKSNINFELYNVTEISIYSILAFIIIGIYAWIFFRFAKLFVTLIKKFSTKNAVIIIFSILVAFIILIYFSDIPLSWISICLFLIIALQWFLKKENLTKYIILILFLSIYIVVQTFQLYSKKKEDLQQVVALSLSGEKDFVAQMLLIDLENKIKQDKFLQGLLNKAYDNRYEIYKYLKDNYFYGFWNKYDLQVTICSNFDNLRLMPSALIVRCFDYFNKIIQTKSSNINANNFYAVSQDYGEISFLGKFCYPYFVISDTSEKCIFLELNSKLIANTPGYPDLLMDSKTYQSLNLQWQNYAKYKNLRLIQKKGNISYPQQYDFVKPSVGKSIITNTPIYKHYIYAPNNEFIIVVSILKTTWYQYVWAILYLFNLLALLFIVFWLVYQLLKNKYDILYGFRFKYISSFLLILIVSYILIAIYTILFFNYRYHQKNTEQLLAKNQTMLNYLEENAGNWSKLFQLTKSELTKLLITTSNIFYSDINIYSPNGQLYATSRPEFFEKGIKSKLIDNYAYSQIMQQNQNQFIHKENIGSFTYLSSYTLLTEKDKIIGILQFPYFTEQEKFRNEISSVLINLINIYILFIFFSLVIVMFMVNNILKPLSYLQKYFKKIRFGKTIEPIIYTQHDEIKPLVTEYNRMLEELARSTEKLLQSERESAWRDIARQIAHEIKNPLTPMKLNIQYLLKQKKEKGYIPDEMLQNTMRILLEQIESLSSIASSFTAFARMPTPNFEDLDLVSEIKKVIHLFSNTETNIQYIDNGIIKCICRVDREYIQRILNNLLTNAIQAIPIDKTKNITVSIDNKELIAIISVKDNGIGIDSEIAQNIFKPSFTTKSSGMGMGLSLVKNMVEMMNGKVYFTSKVNEGTIFFVELPIIQIQKL